MKLPTGFTAARQIRLLGDFDPSEVATYQHAARTGRRILVELRDHTGARILRVSARVIEISPDADTVLGLEVAAVLEVPAEILRELPAARARPNGRRELPAEPRHRQAGRAPAKGESMIPQRADDAVRLWLHLRSGGDQIRSLDLYDSRDVCARCGKGPMTYQGRDRLAVCMACRQPWRPRAVAVVEPRVGKPHERCSRCESDQKVRFQRRLHCATCGAAWEPVSETVAVSARSTPRVRRDLLTLEHVASALIVLRRAIEPKPRESSEAEWAFDLRAFALTLEGNGRSYETAAVEGAGLWPELASDTRWWSEWKVREAVYEARYVIERRLARVARRRQIGRRGEGCMLTRMLAAS